MSRVSINTWWVNKFYPDIYYPFQKEWLSYSLDCFYSFWKDNGHFPFIIQWFSIARSESTHSHFTAPVNHLAKPMPCTAPSDTRWTQDGLQAQFAAFEQRHVTGAGNVWPDHGAVSPPCGSDLKPDGPGLPLSPPAFLPPHHAFQQNNGLLSMQTAPIRSRVQVTAPRTLLLVWVDYQCGNIREENLWCRTDTALFLQSVLLSEKPQFALASL